MKCPACDGTLTEEVRENVAVDVCYGCGGMWLDHGELDGLLTAEERANIAPVGGGSPVAAGARRPEPVTYRKCPRCEQWMGRQNYRKVSGVILDTCHVHGLWLDRGELERLAEFHGAADADKRASRFEASQKEHLDRVGASVRSLNRYVRRNAVGGPMWVHLV